MRNEKLAIFGKMDKGTAKRGKIWDSVVKSFFDLVVFKVIWGLFRGIFTKDSVVLVEDIWDTFDLVVFKIILS